MLFFTAWIQQNAGDATTAGCKFCRIVIKAHVKSLVVHQQSAKHQANAKSMGTTTCITNVLKLKMPEEHVVNELKLATYVAAHSSTASVDHISELIPKLDRKSSILSNMRLHRTKCARLYSLIIDESTNVSGVQCMGINIRYYSRQQRKIVDTMYRLVPLVGATAQMLHDRLVECLTEDKLKLSNLVGIGSDGANAMVGRHHSVATLLLRDHPSIVVFRCVCHSLHLAASKASASMPVALEFLVRETHKWFSVSPKRSLAYQQIYQVLEGKMPKKIPGHSETRWLARLKAVSTILEQWDVIIASDMSL